MSINPTTFYIIISVLVGLLIFLAYINYNLLRKVEKYEDVTADQVGYLQRISNTVRDSQKYLKELDEKGVFQGDDEVGYFFNNMKKVQQELNTYMLPENYGKKES
jgi:hypothetical protein